MIAKLRQNSNIRKAVVIVGLVTMLAGLFGCTEKPGREPIHDTSEVRLVSIGCGHNGIITYVKNYKNPKKLNVHVLDETTYSFCIEFSDGQRYIVGNMVPGQWELEDYFYNLGKELKNGTD